LNYSRLSKDKSGKTKVDLNTVLAETKQDLELLIEEKNATITSAILPTVMGNHTQFGQLFSNLISNSLKFSQSNPLIEITGKTVVKDDIADAPVLLVNERYFEINFKDNGIGFEQQYDKLIFSLFQRLHGNHEYAGTGIGLALCKKIAENHNGFINAKGELDKGATFSLYLPADE
jgi:signal transduction histidine kinase